MRTFMRMALKRGAIRSYKRVFYLADRKHTGFATKEQLREALPKVDKVPLRRALGRQEDVVSHSVCCSAEDHCIPCG